MLLPGAATQLATEHRCSWESILLLNHCFHLIFQIISIQFIRNPFNTLQKKKKKFTSKNKGKCVFPAGVSRYLKVKPVLQWKSIVLKILVIQKLGGCRLFKFSLSLLDMLYSTLVVGVVCSVAKSCLTLHDPMDCGTPGFPVLHYLPEFAQVHVHWVDDAIQPSLFSILTAIIVASSAELDWKIGNLLARMAWVSEVKLLEVNILICVDATKARCLSYAKLLFLFQNWGSNL